MNRCQRDFGAMYIFWNGRVLIVAFSPELEASGGENCEAM